MNNDAQRLTKAFNFASQKHKEQRRKNPQQEPYIVHPAEVANLIAQYTGGNDTNLIIAGLLHDTVEDVGVTFEEIEQEFGSDVAGLVREVTDDKTLEKQERKRLQIEHAAHATPRAKVLKLADKTANLEDQLRIAPEGWSTARIDEYFNWSKSVVDQVRGVCPDLEARFDRAYKARMCP
jgi:guanosine-3',5'-bis(diphosphate) 3'-pyrophosphohydrolase